MMQKSILALAFGVVAAEGGSKDASIYIIRHGEKNHIGDLSDVGKRRAMKSSEAPNLQVDTKIDRGPPKQTKNGPKPPNQPSCTHLPLEEAVAGKLAGDDQGNGLRHGVPRPQHRQADHLHGWGGKGGEEGWLTEAGETCSCSSVENDKVQGEGRVNPT